MANHAAPLQVFTWVETWGIDQGDEGNVEGIAEGHESGRFLACRNVESAGKYNGLVGDDAYYATIDTSKGGDYVCCPPGAKFKIFAVINKSRNDLAYVV